MKRVKNLLALLLCTVLICSTLLCVASAEAPALSWPEDWGNEGTPPDWAQEATEAEQQATLQAITDAYQRQLEAGYDMGTMSEAGLSAWQNMVCIQLENGDNITSPWGPDRKWSVIIAPYPGMAFAITGALVAAYTDWDNTVLPLSDPFQFTNVGGDTKIYQLYNTGEKFVDVNGTDVTSWGYHPGSGSDVEETLAAEALCFAYAESAAAGWIPGYTDSDAKVTEAGVVWQPFYNNDASGAIIPSFLIAASADADKADLVTGNLGVALASLEGGVETTGEVTSEVYTDGNYLCQDFTNGTLKISKNGYTDASFNGTAFQVTEPVTPEVKEPVQTLTWLDFFDAEAGYPAWAGTIDAAQQTATKDAIYQVYSKEFSNGFDLGIAAEKGICNWNGKISLEYEGGDNVGSPWGADRKWSIIIAPYPGMAFAVKEYMAANFEYKTPISDQFTYTDDLGVTKVYQMFLNGMSFTDPDGSLYTSWGYHPGSGSTEGTSVEAAFCEAYATHAWNGQTLGMLKSDTVTTESGAVYQMFYNNDADGAIVINYLTADSVEASEAFAVTGDLAAALETVEGGITATGAATEAASVQAGYTVQTFQNGGLVKDNTEGSVVFYNTEDYAAFLESIQPKYAAGDLNKDGSLSVTDVVLLRKAILNSTTAEQEPLGDLNSDGSLSVTDVVLLRKAILNSGK